MASKATGFPTCTLDEQWFADRGRHHRPGSAGRRGTPARRRGYQRRAAEAMQLINQAKQAKLQEQLAQTMESFQLGDDASTFNEMRDKIDRRAAQAEAKMQLGAASVDAQMQDIEREVMDMQLQDKLLEYKKSMGLLPGSASSQPSQLPPASDPGNGRSS